ncbi:uncharacterized protein FA14DRAFT_192473 [Meira miltonrushii]|uniref:Uncharacterized protein n=1 Tax=Meira miltonrushii TaxID=1280837 RepID=A0A316V450_9BASI|nr:uncharacterized protein FA14DRAFT_192473 [Meira miltonrushii]PWN32232.1 hypothetical protein FA14DRAFT_192473 [Meira miltonrushii]
MLSACVVYFVICIYFIISSNLVTANDQWLKRAGETSSPSDSFFNLENDAFAQELASKYGKATVQPHHSGIGHAAVQPQHSGTAYATNTEKDEEVASKLQISNRPYVYIPRKHSSQYAKSVTAKRFRQYLSNIRADPKRLQEYRHKKHIAHSQVLSKAGKRGVTPSSPSDSFFDFNDDPFAHELAHTFTKQDQASPTSVNKESPSLNKAPTIKHGEETASKAKGKKKTRGKTKNRTYVYRPKKKEGEYIKDWQAERVRIYQAELRADPVRREAQLQNKRNYYYQKKASLPQKPKYKKFGEKLMPMKDLIQMEKNGTLTETYYAQLKHLRTLRRLSNERSQKKLIAQKQSVQSEDRTKPIEKFILVRRSVQPSSPSNSFFEFENDPFAHELAHTFVKQVPSSPISIKKGYPISSKPRHVEHGEEASSKPKKPYVYRPKKKASEYSTNEHVIKMRARQAEIRSDPAKREIYLQQKKDYRRNQKANLPSGRKHRKFSENLLPMKDLIQMEKSGTLNETHDAQLKHLRRQRHLSNKRYQKKNNAEAKPADTFTAKKSSSPASASKSWDHTPSEHSDANASKTTKRKQPYVYRPRNMDSEYVNNDSAKRARGHQERMRLDPKVHEAYRIRRREAARAKKGTDYKKNNMIFNKPLTPLTQLIALEKAGQINEQQKLELAHQRKQIGLRRFLWFYDYHLTQIEVGPVSCIQWQYRSTLRLIKRTHTPSPPSDEFFNFDDEPFAKQLADKYTAQESSSSVTADKSGDQNVSESQDGKAIRPRKHKVPYVYQPRKDESQYSKNETAKKARNYLKRLRFDPEKNEARLAQRRAERQSFKITRPKKAYKIFGKALTPMKQLIALEKTGKINEVQSLELSHQRADRSASYRRSRDKRKKSM